MAKILVVEDDDYFRAALVQYLTNKQHAVSEAPNGKVAKNVLAATEVDIILSDVQMPFVTGVELLEYVKREKPTAFILMTGFTNLLETKTAFDLGADDFLAKPFKNEELLNAINKIIRAKNGPADSVAGSGVQPEFCKVAIEEFVSREIIEFDVYIRLSQNKIVKIGRAGDSVPRERILNYKEKGVHFLHIKKEDFNKLVGFNMQVMHALKNTDSVSKEKKLNFIKYTNDVLLEKVFVDGVDKQSFNDTKDFLSNTISVLTENSEAFDLLSILNDHTDFIYSHSLGVSLYSIMIARKMEFTTSSIFFKLGLAGMFHDIGKKEIPREILEKNRPLLTQKERALIETHPTRGYEILSALKTMPSEVVQMVYEHHEDNEGQGYPRGLSKNDLHPLSKILIVANHFVEFAIKGPHQAAMSGAAAIKHIEDIYMDRLDRAAMSALKAIFSTDK